MTTRDFLKKCSQFIASNINEVYFFVNLVGRRSLFSSEILGLEAFRRQRAATLDRLGDSKERFAERMGEYVKGSATNTIFTDDLKTMVYLTESEAELDTTLKMVHRYL